MIKVSWQEHFKNSLVGAEEAFQQATSQGSSMGASADLAFLSYCLTQNLIPSREYLEWAKEAHQLPVLMDEFFVTRTAPVDLFQAHQNVFSWNSACLPVAEWDGILMVACLEIPEDFPVGQPAAFLLASPALMSQTWQFLVQALEPQSSEIASSAVEELLGSASSAPKEIFNANGELILKDDEPVAEGSNPVIEVSEEAEGLPEGLFAETVVDATMLTSLAPESESKTATMELHPAPVSAVPSAPASTPAAPAMGLVKGPRTVEPLATLPIMEDSGSISIEAPETASLSAPETASLSASDKTSLSMPGLPMTPVPKAAPQTSEVAAMPTAPVKASTGQSTTAAYLLDKMRKQNPQLFEMDVQNSFKKLKPYFKKSMLLAIGDKDRVIKPLVWDENFQAPQAGQPEFDLRTPSFFRIVATTQKPYHGFVVTNDFNESFFEAWNQGQVPDHITMIPFMDGDQVIGMLLGIGEKSSYNRQVLQVTETVTKELTASLAKLSANPSGTASKAVA